MKSAEQLRKDSRKATNNVCESLSNIKVWFELSKPENAEFAADLQVVVGKLVTKSARLYRDVFQLDVTLPLASLAWIVFDIFRLYVAKRTRSERARVSFIGWCHRTRRHLRYDRIETNGFERVESSLRSVKVGIFTVRWCICKISRWAADTWCANGNCYHVRYLGIECC